MCVKWAHTYMQLLDLKLSAHNDEEYFDLQIDESDV